MEILFGQLQSHLHAIVVGHGAAAFGNALAGKDIVDLAHADGVQPGLLQHIQHGVPGGRDGIVMAAGGAAEIVGAGALKGAGDDTAHGVLAGEHFPGNLAVAIKLLHRHNGLVGGDLEYAVGAGVDDQLAGAQMLFPVIPDHIGAGIGQVAEHAPAGALFKLPDHLVGEAIGIGGQRLGADQTGDLPMADGGILALAALLQAAKGGLGLVHVPAFGGALDIEHSQPGQVGSGKVGMGGNGCQGVGAGIAEIGGVGGVAHTEAVQHNEKYTFFHNSLLPKPQNRCAVLRCFGMLWKITGALPGHFYIVYTIIYHEARAKWYNTTPFFGRSAEMQKRLLLRRFIWALYHKATLEWYPSSSFSSGPADIEKRERHDKRSAGHSAVPTLQRALKQRF